MQTTRKSRKHRLIRNLMIALISVIVILIGIVGFLYFNDNDGPYDRPMPYDVATAIRSTEGGGKNAMEAPAFAADLCVSDANVDLVNIEFQSANERGLLFNLETHEARFARGAYDRVYPASITKIMTAILAVKYGNMDDEVTMRDEDFTLSSDSQVSGLRYGDQVTMRQLFSALLVYSANDAALAIARQIGGDVPHFVAMMNEEAARLGMTGTNFVNPHGLHDKDHYTTPYDVYLMLNEAAQYAEITDVMKNSIYKLEIVGMDGAYRAYNLDATDKYLSGEHAIPDGVTIMAGKTGTTDAAGNCLALAVQNRYGIPYIAIVMNAPNKEILYADMDTLLTWTNEK